VDICKRQSGLPNVAPDRCRKASIIDRFLTGEAKAGDPSTSPAALRPRPTCPDCPVWAGVKKKKHLAGRIGLLVTVLGFGWAVYEAKEHKLFNIEQAAKVLAWAANRQHFEQEAIENMAQGTRHFAAAAQSLENIKKSNTQLFDRLSRLERAQTTCAREIGQFGKLLRSGSYEIVHPFDGR
jgi:hypothetical protein